jgi:hypothetical protein
MAEVDLVYSFSANQPGWTNSRGAIIAEAY